MAIYKFPQVPNIEGSGKMGRVENFDWGTAPNFSEIKNVFLGLRFEVSDGAIYRKIAAHFRKAKEYFERLAVLNNLDISMFDWGGNPDFNMIAASAETLATHIDSMVTLDQKVTVAIGAFTTFATNLRYHIIKSEDYFAQFVPEG